MKKEISALYFALACIFCSCTQSMGLKPAAYLNVLEDQDNSYRKVVCYSDIVYTVQLITPEFLVLKELLGPDNTLDTIEYNERLAEISDHIFFSIKISKSPDNGAYRHVPDNQEAEQMVMYYQQDFSNDITLNIDGKPQAPDAYIFENNYSLSPYNTILIGFVVNKTTYNNLQLIFNDRYHNKPLIKAAFTKQEISKIPSLTLNNQ